MSGQERETCPCCGYRTITGTFDICGICGWEHDPVQESRPYHDNLGPNKVTLEEAQRNFAAFGAKSREALADARKPSPDTPRDPDWKPLAEQD